MWAIHTQTILTSLFFSTSMASITLPLLSSSSIAKMDDKLGPRGLGETYPPQSFPNHGAEAQRRGHSASSNINSSPTIVSPVVSPYAAGSWNEEVESFDSGDIGQLSHVPLVAPNNESR